MYYLPPAKTVDYICCNYTLAQLYWEVYIVLPLCGCLCVALCLCEHIPKRVLPRRYSSLF